MPSQKGLSNTVWIITAALVALVIALILLGVFTDVLKPMIEWIQSLLGGKDGGEADTCSRACNIWQAVCVEGSTKPYSQFPGCMKVGICRCLTETGNKSG